MNKIFNWGIIGPGAIAHKFVEALKFLPQASLQGVVSTNLESAQRFARQYNIPIATNQLNELLDSDVDAVYIATPHHAHCQLTVDCLTNGKAVLCEKPLAVNHKQVSEIIEAAKTHNCFLMEALWTRFLPHIEKLIEQVNTDTFGKIAFIDSNFAFKTEYPPGHRYNNPALAGGSLLDIGIYPIFLCYLLLGKPTQIKADALLNEQGVDRTLQALLKFKDDARANIFSSFHFNGGAKAHIYSCTGCAIHISDKFNTPSNMILENAKGEQKNIEIPFDGNGFNYQIDEVHRCLVQKKLQSNMWSWQNSLDLVDIMDQVRANISLKYPFE
ncbi:Gfo/Idh/MocA family oxidoreductase [Aliikangiella marina]|uniref:Gfo/Idh/MocA family oxidoreductase n=1 Tax=Aliikangiella marina TaxID=1712262 RepID=A0A545T9S0_9GAMM|nr:Gfo/Idh/MocA family oxidoreductase [Aliikangiella marina]TQV73954.1 Gfo/Idh/MocA family oxidoreductase [Aliikangiella marina]